MLSTITLQNNLKHCNGRKTVEIIGSTVYHYNTPILTIEDDIIEMHPAWAYSPSTSRVRNAALAMLGFPELPPTTEELRKAKGNGEVLQFAGYNIIFEEWR